MEESWKLYIEEEMDEGSLKGEQELAGRRSQERHSEWRELHIPKS
jgi:hypothetical protein